MPREIVEFTDYDDHRVRVQWSSLATQPTARVYIKREGEEAAGHPVDACLHLTAPQVSMLIAGLQEWQTQMREDW